LGLAVTLACLVVAALAFHKLSSAAHRSRSTAARA
jgi:hypothetical protein